MNLRSLLNCKQDVKKIGLFGLGRSNIALLATLPSDAEITLRSDKKIDRAALPKDARITKIYDGEHACERICEQVIFFSPSVRRERTELVRARERGVIFSSDCELFFENMQAPIYAVTGSDGKSTTATLVRELLTEKYGTAALCGNIGLPFVSASSADAYVCELSSFQLTYLKPFTERAAITNITPNHLNWHSSFEEYKETKLSLLSHTRGAVLNVDDPILSEMAKRRTPFSLISTQNSYQKIKCGYDFSVAYTLEGECICRNGTPYIRVRDLGRREAHNVKNFMLALAITEGMVSDAHALRVGSEFRGLAHRCEHFASLGGVDFFDSSIDTSPERTKMTLTSLGRKCVVLLGGRSKRLPFDTLLPVLKNHAKFAVLYGECTDEIHALIAKIVPTKRCASLDEAALCAARLAEHG
ncbi:MAG: UDP-N-acetylmuramoyl-L-alanine--D-glutamate ligase, partial [Clostridia bacterium]|nr:UDP-N-acetylmuramoyl-L-alanine--D-glutamate ligase [Clostridia bacterium]